jgi:glyoxylase-like metal-dependent hydrolase (beta-lactamase superfamily II)
MKPGVKRALKIAGIVLLVLVAIPALAFYSAFAGNSAIQDGQEMQTTVRLIKDGFVTVGMIDLGDGKVALIDAGNDASGKAILAELARRKLGPEAVSAILITHGHSDHLAAIPLFPDAGLFALEAEVPLIEGKVGMKSPMGRFVGAKPTGISIRRRLTDGEAFIIGQRRAQVFAIPGHTAGSAAYLIEGVLFLGDSAGVKSDGSLAAAPYVFSDDQAQNRASLKTLAARLQPMADEVQFLSPAHTGTAKSLAPLLAFAASH